MKQKPKILTYKGYKFFDDGSGRMNLLKVYKDILKTEPVEKMSNLFNSFISAYRESYNTQHVLIY